jgi:hypothetical protein
LGWRNDVQLLHGKTNAARDALLGIG